MELAQRRGTETTLFVTNHSPEVFRGVFAQLSPPAQSVRDFFEHERVKGMMEGVKDPPLSTTMRTTFCIEVECGEEDMAFLYRPTWVEPDVIMQLDGSIGQEQDKRVFRSPDV